MGAVEEYVDIDVPPAEAYAHWTSFETFPRFMDGVEEVRLIDERRLLWRATLAGTGAEWECEITEQRPDERIAWRSTSGMSSSGVISFHPLGEHSTRVTVMAELATEVEPVYRERLRDVLARYRALAQR